ncbi:uncharacterized protein Bfra_001917 [Botrytis fragariae]|uniref:Uncharacterized protein n=1 Tax=Botrytis fragariae TaxID=1964551 RepID=A0A8H6B1U4_9HELO|nr:uncharacterized protein Bfra_001917 [Botrytis fragariae]KAF5877550.1 hypothetical protein Bfra_001917 [Botrytis fragariae]
MPSFETLKNLDASENISSSSRLGNFTFIQVGNDRGPRTEARSHVMREFGARKSCKGPRKLEPKTLKRKAVQAVGRYLSGVGNKEAPASAHLS